MSQHEGMWPEGSDQLSEPLVDPRAPWEELIEDPAAPRRLLAVMFTDIIGSTELATTLGDKRWRELLEQHDAAIRTQITRFGGREVDTAGDAFFVTFELPIRAVDCALEAARAIRRLGLRIRAGVHMGECVVSNGKVRGVSVHIGARVAAKARGDEVLVSSTVRDILAGAGLKFADRGEQTLKGVEGRWRLYAVEPRERDNEADLPPLLETEIANAPLPWWRSRRTMVAGITAMAVLIGAVAFAVTRGGGLSSVPADSVAVIDAGAATVESFLPVRRRPVGVVATADGIWVTNSIDGSVTWLKEEGASETIGVGAGPIEVTSGRNAVWVANANGQTVSRVSPQTGGVVGEPIVSGNGLSDIAFGAGALWITHSVDGTVWRVDPTSNTVTNQTTVGAALRGIAVARDQVWVTSQAAGTVSRLDPRSGAILAVVRVGNGAGAVAIGERDVWVANAFDGTVSQVDPRTRSVRRTVRVGRGPRAIALAGGKTFVANEVDGTVSVIERSGAVKTIVLQNAPMGLAASVDRVWVTVRGGISRYQGGTLRFGTSGDDLGAGVASIDPHFHPYSSMALMLTGAAFDGLVGFKKEGGVEGSELVANLAEEIRAPTDGGRTYSFTLRENLRYSDGTPVRASDVRTSFERILTGDGIGALFVRSLVGSEKCEPNKPCDLSAGVTTGDDARTVVLRLKRPIPDFPYMLAHPFLSIVPPSAPPTDATFTPIPGTGPYGVAATKGDKTKGEVVLERNRHFRPRGNAQPGGYPDRIELRWGDKPEDHVRAVKENRIDVTNDPENRFSGVAELVNEMPAQVQYYDLPAILFGILNTRVPPFNDVRVRKALNLAIDRRPLEGIAPRWGELSCQSLPKNVVGYVPYCPYTGSPNPSGVWTAPDLDRARALVRESGTAGQQVTVWLDSQPGVQFDVQRRVAPIYVRALQAIGFRATMREIPGDYIEPLVDPSSRHQIALSGWFSDYPAASSFVIPLSICTDTFTRLTGQEISPGTGWFNLGRFCSREIDAKVEQALGLPYDDVEAQRELWVEIDRMVTDAAPRVTMVNFRGVMFVSKRVGNVLGHGVYGPLITQMWVVEEPRPTPS